MPSIMDAVIPESAAGITTLYIVCHFVDPKAKAPSFNDFGTELIASSDIDMTVGRAITPKIIAPVSAV